MTAKLTPNLRLRNAQDFLENLVSGAHTVDRNHYLFIGRTKAWPTIRDTQNKILVSEYSPPTPLTTVKEDGETRDHMIALKRIRDVDATLCVRRFNWDTSGRTIYAPYDDNDPELFNHPTQLEINAANASPPSDKYYAGSHYVMTEDYHIFKCLSNGNGAKSTQMPTKPNGPPYIQSTSDGYVWKYMGSVTNFQTQYFLTNQWLPVKKATNSSQAVQLDVQNTATNGSIDSYLIKNQGAGYTNVHSGQITAKSSNTAVLSAGASASDNAYKDCHIFVVGSGGSAGPFVVTGYVGSTKTLTISGTWSVNVGDNYEILPQAIVTGNGTGATAKVLVQGGKVQQVLPINRGLGYTVANLEIRGGRATGGTLASVQPQIAPIGGHGSDIERELNACFVMLTGRLVYDDGSKDFPLSNDYRQVGVIRDVKANGTTSLATAQTLRASRGIDLTGINGNFQPDELITGTTTSGIVAQGRVIAFIKPNETSTTGTIHYYQDSETGYVPFTSGMTVRGQDNNEGTVATNGTIAPEIEKLSGDILYIDNRRAILRAPNQTEILRAVIKF